MNMPQGLPEDRTIIDETAILKVKQYIARKHPGLTAEERAAVFANAIHRIIDRHLPDFEEGIKVRLRQELLARMGLERRFTLLTGHVLEACLKLELEESGLEQLGMWMDKHRLAAVPGLPVAAPCPAPAPLQTSCPDQALPADESQGTAAAGRRMWRFSGVVFLLLFLASAGASAGSSTRSLVDPMVVLPPESVELAAPPPVPDFPLPGEYSYHPVDREELKSWLHSRNSLLAEEPYFTAILEAAEGNNLHPLLLFAITGQEQAYVPKDGKKAKQIANNPFNVHNSWQSYNTGIADSARIASKTILSISRTRPADAHPIQWLNTRYAEDPQWWIGVNSIFEKMRREIHSQ